MAEANPVIWAPSVRDLQDSSLARFRDAVNKRYDISLNTYEDIHAWSIDPKTREEFWMATFEFLDLRAIKSPSKTFIGVSVDFKRYPEAAC